MPNDIEKVIDIEREIEAKYVIALRTIFEFDNKFIYNKDDKLTKVLITAEYPDKQAVLKTPHIVIAGISYQFDTENAFYKNYARNVFDENGRCIGSVSVNVVPYNANIICVGEQYLSKDLANKVVNYLVIAAKEIFEGLHLNIRSVSKGQTGPYRQYPDKAFETSIAIQGHVQWQGTSKTTDIAQLHILQKIKDTIISK